MYMYLLNCCSQEQAEATESGDGGEAGQGAAGGQVRGVQRPHTEGSQECLRRGKILTSNGAIKVVP